MHYKSAEDLLAVLEGRGLEIRDRALAAHYFSTVGHHRLSNFYGFFYSDAKTFDQAIPTTIDDVVHLYSFDRRLRLLLIGPLEKIEVGLRAMIIKEIGDYLRATKGDPARINLFDPDLYDLSTKQNRRNYDLAKDSCWRGARTYWKGKSVISKRRRAMPPEEWDREFSQYYSNLPAWALLQTSSFGPLAHIFSILRPEIAYRISEKFNLPRVVLNTAFFALKEVRNSCAHHEPVWNWDARYRAVQLKFPKIYSDPAKIDSENITKIYAYCATIHILLGFLSNGSSTWHRRLKKLVNEFSTMYSSGMGFPEDWQSMPFWCVSDVARSPIYERLRSRVQARETDR